VKAQATNFGAGRTIAGTVNALVAAYLDPNSKSSPFKTGAAETQRTRRNILEKFRTSFGDLPLFRIERNGERTMLLTREHMQRIVNEKASSPFRQRNFLNTLRAVFRWGMAEGRVPDVGRSGEPFPAGVEIHALVDELEPLDEDVVDRDLWAILSWMIEGVGGDWKLEDFLATGRLLRVPAASE
jgi:hypothetical protein